MKKEATTINHSDNSFGTASVILGIFSILFISPPVYGFILGVISFIFANKQQKRQANKWSKAGKILATIGMILSVLAFFALYYVAQHPELLQQFTQV